MEIVHGLRALHGKAGKELHQLGWVKEDLGGKVESFVDLSFVAAKATTNAEIDAAIEEASKGSLKGIIGINRKPLVSVDFNHDPRSSIYDATLTQVMGGTLVKVCAWYDNEWGFSNRMLDVTNAFVAAK